VEPGPRAQGSPVGSAGRPVFSACGGRDVQDNADRGADDGDPTRPQLCSDIIRAGVAELRGGFEPRPDPRADTTSGSGSLWRPGRSPLDRLRIQDGFLAAHAPHLMSSWVTDSPGLFDDRPRSLAFRFVLASAGVLGIGADITHWPEATRAEARGWVARYKAVRDVIHTGTVHRIGGPGSRRCAVQYTLGSRVVVLAWNTGGLDGRGQVPARDIRLPLRGLDPAAHYRHGDTVYSGTHLMAVGLPVRWTHTHDADLVELRRQVMP
jgi:hypothetical protein